jgi:hypothetical protein
VPEQDLDLPHETLENLHDQRPSRWLIWATASAG